MKKFCFILLIIIPITAFTQQLTFKDLLYLFEHNQYECNNYLARVNFNAEPPDYRTDENGCRRYSWVLPDEKKVIRDFVFKRCDDGNSGNIKYLTGSKEVYNELMNESQTNDFDYLNTTYGKKGEKIIVYHRGYTISTFSVNSSEWGDVYMITIENL